MDRDYIIKLVLLVYQASENFPEDNFLKFKIRNLANEILTDFILFSQKNPLGNIPEILGKIERLQENFREVRAQKLLDRKKFLLLKREYNKIGEELKKFFPKKPEEKESVKISEGLNERQKRILEILREKEKVQVRELKEFFSETSKRTLRRDLEELLKKELVERSGEWNQIFYNLSRVGQR